MSRTATASQNASSRELLAEEWASAARAGVTMTNLLEVLTILTIFTIFTILTILIILGARHIEPCPHCTTYTNHTRHTIPAILPAQVQRGIREIERSPRFKAEAALKWLAGL